MAHQESFDNNNSHFMRRGYKNITHNVNTSPNNTLTEATHLHSINIPKDILKRRQYKTKKEFELLPNKLTVASLSCYYSNYVYKSNSHSKPRHKSHKVPKSNKSTNKEVISNNDEVEQQNNIEILKVSNFNKEEEYELPNKEIEDKKEDKSIRGTRLQDKKEITQIDEEELDRNTNKKNSDIINTHNRDHYQIKNELTNKFILEPDIASDYTEQLIPLEIFIPLKPQELQYDKETIENKDNQHKTEKPIRPSKQEQPQPKLNQKSNNINSKSNDDNPTISQLSHSFTQYNQIGHLDDSQNTITNFTVPSITGERRRPLEIIKRNILLRKPNNSSAQTSDSISKTAKHNKYPTLNLDNNAIDDNKQQIKICSFPSLLIDISQEVQPSNSTEHKETEPIVKVYKKKKSSKDIKQNRIAKEVNIFYTEDNDTHERHSRNYYQCKEKETKMDTIKDVKPATELHDYNTKDKDINVVFNQYIEKYNSNNNEDLTQNTEMNYSNNENMNDKESELLYLINHKKQLEKQYDDNLNRKYNDERINKMNNITYNDIICNNNNNMNSNDNHSEERYETITAAERKIEGNYFKSEPNRTDDIKQLLKNPNVRHYINNTDSNQHYNSNKEPKEYNDDNNITNNQQQFYHSTKAYRDYNPTINNNNNCSINSTFNYTRSNKNNEFNSQLHNNKQEILIQKDNDDHHLSHINTNINNYLIENKMLTTGSSGFNIRNPFELEVTNDDGNYTCSQLKSNSQTQDETCQFYQYHTYDNSKRIVDHSYNIQSDNQEIQPIQNKKSYRPLDQSLDSDLTNRYKAFRYFNEKTSNQHYNNNECDYKPINQPINDCISKKKQRLKVSNDKYCNNNANNSSIYSPLSAMNHSYYYGSNNQQYDDTTFENVKLNDIGQFAKASHDNNTNKSNVLINSNEEINDNENKNLTSENRCYTYESLYNYPIHTNIIELKKENSNQKDKDDKGNNNQQENNFYLYYGFGNQKAKDLSYNRYREIIDQQQNKTSALFQSNVLHNINKDTLYMSPTDFYYNTNQITSNDVANADNWNQSYNKKNIDQSQSYDNRRLFEEQKVKVDNGKVTNTKRRKVDYKHNYVLSTVENIKFNKDNSSNNRNCSINNYERVLKTQSSNCNCALNHPKYAKLFVNLDDFKKKKLQFI